MRKRAGGFGILSMMTAGVLALALRGPGQPPVLAAQGESKAAAIDPKALPADATVVLAIRSGELLKKPVYKPLIDSLSESKGGAGSFPFQKIESALVMWRAGFEVDPNLPPVPPPSRVVVRTIEPYDWKAFIKAQNFNGEEREVKGKTYVRAGNDPFGFCFGVVDDRTMAIAPEAEMQRLLAGDKDPDGAHAWDDAWKQVARGQAAIVVDGAWLAAQIKKFEESQFGEAAKAKLEPFKPLWEDAKGIAISVDESTGLALDAVATCETEDGAKRVAEAFDAIVTLSKPAVEGIQADLAAKEETKAPAKLVEEGILPLLNNIKIDRDGKTVRVRGAAKFDVKLAVDSFALAIKSSRASAKRVQSINNLKQIMLAMHNYHSAHDTFPPPAIKSKEGKPLLSWRVAILPYIEQQGLYEQFHLDEPWDSEHNKALIDKIPPIYRAPSAKTKATSSCYYALTGPDAIFKEDGTKIQEITDGTSNTIAVVEADRDIPWTKPEDIPYDADKDLPKLGGISEGGFNVGFADGSVRFLKKDIDEQTLRALITRAGGEVVQIP
jgi:prepilin-type processing-associated H-X9-DG protein